MGDVEQLIPNVDKGDGVLKNLAEIAEEHRKGNIQCLMLCLRRKGEASTRTFFVGADDPHMFRTLVRLEHDMLNLCAYDVTNVVEYFDEDGDEEGNNV